MLKIYENYNAGKINDDEYDFFLYEMKSRKEYANRRFSNIFHFEPFDDDPYSKIIKGYQSGILILDGVAVLAYMVPNKKIILPNGAKLDIQTSCDTRDGSIIINRDILMQLKNDVYRKGIISHEIGHSLFHSKTSENPSLSDQVLIEIVVDIVNAPRIETDNYIECLKQRLWRFVPIYMDYVSKLRHGPLTEREKTLQSYRKSCMDVFSKYFIKGHTNPTEFEADKFAANKIGIREMCKALKNMHKVITKDLKRQYLNAINTYKAEYNTVCNQIKQSKYNETDKNQKLKQLKTIYDSKMTKVGSEYRTLLHNNEIDIRQRIKVLKDVDILMDNHFNEVYD